MAFELWDGFRDSVPVDIWFFALFVFGEPAGLAKFVGGEFTIP